MTKHIVLLIFILAMPFCCKAQATALDTLRGTAVWQFYRGGSVIKSIPVDSIDSVAVVSKRLIKMLDSNKELLYSRMISQTDSICLGYYTNKDSLAFVDAAWNWKDIGKGALLGSAIVPIFGITECVSILKFPISNFTTELIDSQNPDQGTVPAIANRLGAFGAINASFFNMTSYYPHTYFFVNGKMAFSATTDYVRSNGYVAFKDAEGKRISIGNFDPEKTDYYYHNFYSFLETGPILMLGKHIQPIADNDFNNVRHPRSVIGYDKKGYIYFMVVDGRMESYGAYGASITELALMTRYAGMDYSVNLDGGGSSTLWTQPNGVVNYPCNNSKFDHTGLRVVPSIIMMK